MIKNFAHRGFRSKYPENTLLAFQKAIEANCSGIEFDVHLTKDQEIVIIHDETLEGTTNGKGRVKDHTLRELKHLDASNTFHSQFGFQEIPTLKEYFELVKDLEIISNIELKTGVYDYPGIEEKVYDLIVEFGLQSKVIVSSFNHESIMRMKNVDQKIICGALFDTWTIHPENYVKEIGVECYHPVAYSLRKEIVHDLKSRGIIVNAWLGKEPVNFSELIEMGIDGIITDYPDVIDQLISR